MAGEAPFDRGCPLLAGDAPFGRTGDAFRAVCGTYDGRCHLWLEKRSSTEDAPTWQGIPPLAGQEMLSFVGDALFDTGWPHLTVVFSISHVGTMGAACVSVKWLEYARPWVCFKGRA